MTRKRALCFDIPASMPAYERSPESSRARGPRSKRWPHPAQRSRTHRTLPPQESRCGPRGVCGGGPCFMAEGLDSVLPSRSDDCATIGVDLANPVQVHNLGRNNLRRQLIVGCVQCRWLVALRNLNLVSGITFAASIPRLMGRADYGRDAHLASTADWYALAGSIGLGRIVRRRRILCQATADLVTVRPISRLSRQGEVCRGHHPTWDSQH